MKTAFEYRRISNEDQSNFSITGQALVNAEWCKRNNITIVKTFVDDGYSAKDFDRPEWKKMETELTASKGSIDYLIVSKYDRLIRNVVEGLTFVERLEKKLNITLLSVMENHSMDIYDPYFFKHRAEIFVDAEFERRRISDRSRMGMWSGRSQGRYLNPAPFGYLNRRDPDNKPIIVINPELQKIIEDIFTNFLNGDPLSVITKKARDAGFTMKGKEAVRRVLSNPVYGGLIMVPSYKGSEKKLIKGLHDGVVPEEMYWKAHYKLKDFFKPQMHDPLNVNFPLRGFVHCEHCGNAHTGSRIRGRSAYYFYYWCGKCRGTNYKNDKMHADLAEMLKGLSLKKDYIERLKVEFDMQVGESDKSRKVRLQKEIRESLEIERKLHSLEEKYITDSIEKSTYQNWYATYNDELNRKKVVISSLQENSSQQIETFKEYAHYLGDLNWLYEKAEMEDKQTFLKFIFPAGLIVSQQGYQTAFVHDLFFINTLSIAHLLTIKKQRELSFLDNSPLGVANGNEIEPFFKFIEKIISAA